MCSASCFTFHCTLVHIIYVYGNQCKYFLNAMQFGRRMCKLDIATRFKVRMLILWILFPLISGPWEWRLRPIPREVRPAPGQLPDQRRQRQPRLHGQYWTCYSLTRLCNDNGYNEFTVITNKYCRSRKFVIIKFDCILFVCWGHYETKKGFLRQSFAFRPKPSLQSLIFATNNDC